MADHRVQGMVALDPAESGVGAYRGKAAAAKACEPGADPFMALEALGVGAGAHDVHYLTPKEHPHQALLRLDGITVLDDPQDGTEKPQELKNLRDRETSWWPEPNSMSTTTAGSRNRSRRKNSSRASRPGPLAPHVMHGQREIHQQPAKGGHTPPAIRPDLLGDLRQSEEIEIQAVPDHDITVTQPLLRLGQALRIRSNADNRAAAQPTPGDSQVAEEDLLLASAADTDRDDGPLGNRPAAAVRRAGT